MKFLKTFRNIFVSFLVVAVLFVVCLFYLQGGRVDSSKYQAVFLTNGQVYFGKLTGLHTQHPVLTEIYYLIVTRPLQSQQEEATSSAQASDPNYSLRKLGNELHGPEDKMILNKDHILFVEDLRDTGKVVDSIIKYQQAQEVAPETIQDE